MRIAFLCHPLAYPVEPTMIHRAAPMLDRVDAALAKLSGPVLLTFVRRDRRQVAGRG